MIKNNDRIMLNNHTQAILKLTDLVGQLIDCLAKHNIKFEYKEGKLLDEKKDD